MGKKQLHSKLKRDLESDIGNESFQWYMYVFSGNATLYQLARNLRSNAAFQKFFFVLEISFRTVCLLLGALN